MMPRILAASEAVQLIQDNAVVCIGGAGAGHTVPDTVIRALGNRFLREGNPRNLTIIHPCGIGDGEERGLNYLAREGLVKKEIGGFWGNAPKMSALALDNKIHGYNFPQGVLTHLIRAAAGGFPGVITVTGLHTFTDPRLEGGKINSSAPDGLVSLTSLHGEEYLFYKSIPVNAAIIRGTSADCEGNISMEEEVGTFAMLSMAQAAKINRGIVIAQVKRTLPDRHTPPVNVKVPGVFVDAVVVEPDQEMTFISRYDESLIKRDAPISKNLSIPEGIKSVISRRAAKELKDSGFVNVGYGMSDGVPIAVKNQKNNDNIIFMIEQGALGGIPSTGLNFGAMHNPSAIIDDGYMFDFFHGGGLDASFLGFAQVDASGNVNSSRFGSVLTGCGGFIDISQHTRKVVFCGTFSVKGQSHSADGRLHILHPGTMKKFVKNVDQVTFSGRYSRKNNQEVVYVTERAVFKCVREGIMLTEIAPGIDMRQDILNMMEFDPIIAEPLQIMDASLFS